MATIRMTLSAGAALVALAAFVPAVSLAQAPKAPLELATQAQQTQTSTGVATGKNAAKTSGKTKKTSARQNSAQPSAQPTPSNSRTAANPAASRQSQPTTSAATPAIAARAVAAPQAHDNVMRGRDTISLVARLPWWRNDRMQSVSYGGVAVESQVMAAADAWLAANGGKAAADTADRETAASAPADEVLADAGEINDIDLAAKASVPAPPSPTFLQSLLAILGGAAAAAAASARFLFT